MVTVLEGLLFMFRVEHKVCNRYRLVSGVTLSYHLSYGLGWNSLKRWGKLLCWKKVDLFGLIVLTKEPKA